MHGSVEPTIRKYVLSDFDDFCALANTYANEMGEGEHFDPSHLRTYVDDMLCAPSCSSIYVAELHGAVVGFSFLITNLCYFSSRLTAVQELIYVHPDYRNIGTARALLHTFTNWAKEKGAYRALCPVNSGINIEALANLYEKVGGFTKVGFVSGKEL